MQVCNRIGLLYNYIDKSQIIPSSYMETGLEESVSSKAKKQQYMYCDSNNCKLVLTWMCRTEKKELTDSIALMLLMVCMTAANNERLPSGPLERECTRISMLLKSFFTVSATSYHI
jgi:hypothetical protein